MGSSEESVGGTTRLGRWLSVISRGLYIDQFVIKTSLAFWGASMAVAIISYAYVLHCDRPDGDSLRPDVISISKRTATKQVVRGNYFIVPAYSGMSDSTYKYYHFMKAPENTVRMSRQDSDALFKQSILVRWFHQTIPTARANILVSHWEVLSAFGLCVLFPGFFFFCSKTSKMSSRTRSSVAVLLVAVAVILTPGSILTMVNPRLFIDNATAKDLLIRIDNLEFTLPSRTYAELRLLPGNYRILAKNLSTSDQVDHAKISIPKQGVTAPIFFNIAGQNSYKYEASYYTKN